MADPITLTLADATEMSGVGRSRLYELIAQGQIEARKCGRRTLVTTASLRRYIESLPLATIRAPRQAA